MDYSWLIPLLSFAFIAGIVAIPLYIFGRSSKKRFGLKTKRWLKYSLYLLAAVVVIIFLQIVDIDWGFADQTYTDITGWFEGLSTGLLLISVLLVVCIIAAVFSKGWRDSLVDLIPLILLLGFGIWFFNGPEEAETNICQERVSTEPGTYFEFKRGCRVVFNASQVGVATLEQGIQSTALYQWEHKYGVLTLLPHDDAFALHGTTIPMVVLPPHASDEQLAQYRTIAKTRGMASMLAIATTN